MELVGIGVSIPLFFHAVKDSTKHEAMDVSSLKAPRPHLSVHPHASTLRFLHAP